MLTDCKLSQQKSQPFVQFVVMLFGGCYLLYQTLSNLRLFEALYDGRPLIATAQSFTSKLCEFKIHFDLTIFIIFKKMSVHFCKLLSTSI